MAACTVNVLSLCSGLEGIGLGLGLVIPSTRVICFVEREIYAAEVLVSRIKEGFIHDAPIFSDVKSFDGKPWCGVVDIITAGYPCFAAGTLVLTEEGYCPIESLVVGNRVLTHTGRWQAVTSIMRRDNAPLMRIKAGGVPGVVCTTEHPFWTRLRTHQWENRRRTSIRVFPEPQWTPAEQLTGSHFVGQVLPTARENDKPAAFWWIIGRYLADGYSLARKDRAAGGRVIFCIGKAKAAEFARRLDDAGYHGYQYEERTAIKFHVTRNGLYEFVQRFGHLAHNKRIPKIAIELDRGRSCALLDGYLSGDGSTSECGERSATTTSKALALGIALLAQRAYGVVAGVRRCEMPSTTEIEGRVVNQRDFYTVRIPRRNRSAFISGEYGWKRVTQSMPHGVGVVYNISVAHDESYIADGAIVHNCQPFSCAGKQQGANDPRHLWPDVARIIREVRPPLVFLENVPNHLRLGFREVGEELSGMGYRFEAGLFSAEEVGAPHRRERLFVLAHSSERDAQRYRTFSKLLLVPGRSVQPCVSLRGVANGMANANGRLCNASREELTPSLRNETPTWSERYVKDMADTKCIKCSKQHGTDVLRGWQSEAEQVRVGGIGMGDAPRVHGQWSEPRRIKCRQSEATTRDTSYIVGNSESRGAIPAQQSRCTCCTEQADWYMGNSDFTGLEGHGLPGECPSELSSRQASCEVGVGLFPPKPSDGIRWAEVINEHPSLAPSVEPEVRGVVDGASDRMGKHKSTRQDELRALGNAVLPACAAVAFITLAHRLRLRKGT